MSVILFQIETNLDSLVSVANVCIYVMMLFIIASDIYLYAGKSLFKSRSNSWCFGMVNGL